MDGSVGTGRMAMTKERDGGREKLASGRNSNPCSSWSVGIYFQGKKDFDRKTEPKIDIKIFYLVRTNFLISNH